MLLCSAILLPHLSLSSASLPMRRTRMLGVCAVLLKDWPVGNNVTTEELQKMKSSHHVISCMTAIIALFLHYSSPLCASCSCIHHQATPSFLLWMSNDLLHVPICLRLCLCLCLRSPSFRPFAVGCKHPKWLSVLVCHQHLSFSVHSSACYIPSLFLQLIHSFTTQKHMHALSHSIIYSKFYITGFLMVLSYDYIFFLWRYYFQLPTRLHLHLHVLLSLLATNIFSLLFLSDAGVFLKMLDITGTLSFMCYEFNTCSAFYCLLAFYTLYNQFSYYSMLMQLELAPFHHCHQHWGVPLKQPKKPVKGALGNRRSKVYWPATSSDQERSNGL